MPAILGALVGMLLTILFFGIDVSMNQGNNAPTPPSWSSGENGSGPLKSELPPHLTIDLTEDEEPTPPPTRKAQGDVTDAIWKFYAPDGRTGTAFAIGLSADGQKVFLITSAHCVMDETAIYELGGGHFGEDVRYPGVKVLGRDAANDVALLEAPMLEPYRPITVNRWVSGVENLPISMAGYGGGEWSQHETTLVKAERLSNEVLGLEGPTPECWVTANISEPGHSGSPVWDDGERLIGILCGSSEVTSVIVHVRYVRWLLEQCGQEELIASEKPREADVSDQVTQK